MRMFQIWAFILTCVLSVHAEKVAEFPDMMQPVRFTLDGGEIYVVDGRSKVEVYSVSGGKLLREISKSGQGPGEFQRLPFLKIFPDSIFLGAYNKILVFSKDGKLMQEKRLFPIGKAFPVGDHYVSFGTVREGDDVYRTVNLLDSDLTVIKELHRQLRIPRKGGINPIRDYMDFESFGGNIYIADSRGGLTIHVFDSKGENLYTIDKEMEKIRIPSDFKSAYIEQLSSRPGGQGQEWRAAVDRWGVEYDRYFPDIREFRVDDDKIFVQTYRSEQGKTEFVIMDLNGHSSFSIFLPLFEEGSLVDEYVHAFHEGNYYYLKYDGRREIWELHRIPIGDAR